MTQTDATAVAEQITSYIPMVSGVGVAVLTLTVGLLAFHWIRRAMGGK